MEEVLGLAASAGSVDERRRRKRRPISGNAFLSLLDGPLAGQEYEVTTRDINASAITMLLKHEIRPAQKVKIDLLNGKTHRGEVVRVRPLSSGRFEIDMAIDMSFEPRKVDRPGRRSVKI